MPAKTYTPSAISDFAATYDYVKNAEAQIVDARTPQEFGAGSIPNAIPIPYESVITGDRIKDESLLEKIFASLNKDQPVVVYTNTGIKGSVVWFALRLQGYEARLYSYEDWLSHQQASGNATDATA
jgi:thiosulfate/3-mercaptopyruvate sulfurtransferase